jgi:hypothetical protein
LPARTVLLAPPCLRDRCRRFSPTTCWRSGFHRSTAIGLTQARRHTPIRERTARKRTLKQPVSTGPGLRKDPGPLFFGLRIGAGCVIHAITRSLTICRKTHAGSGRACSLAKFADDASVLASSASLRVCPCTPSLHTTVLATRDGRGLDAGHVQRDTTFDGRLALGHSRSDCSNLKKLMTCRVRLGG